MVKVDGASSYNAPLPLPPSRRDKPVPPPASLDAAVRAMVDGAVHERVVRSSSDEVGINLEGPSDASHEQDAARASSTENMAVIAAKATPPKLGTKAARILGREGIRESLHLASTSKATPAEKKERLNFIQSLVKSLISNFPSLKPLLEKYLTASQTGKNVPLATIRDLRTAIHNESNQSLKLTELDTELASQEIDLQLSEDRKAVAMHAGQHTLGPLEQLSVGHEITADDPHKATEQLYSTLSASRNVKSKGGDIFYSDKGVGFEFLRAICNDQDVLSSNNLQLLVFSEAFVQMESRGPLSEAENQRFETALHDMVDSLKMQKEPPVPAAKIKACEDHVKLLTDPKASQADKLMSLQLLMTDLYISKGSQLECNFGSGVKKEIAKAKEVEDERITDAMMSGTYYRPDPSAFAALLKQTVSGGVGGPPESIMSNAQNDLNAAVGGTATEKIFNQLSLEEQVPILQLLDKYKK